jgi:hypothetical protein
MHKFISTIIVTLALVLVPITANADTVNPDSIQTPRQYTAGEADNCADSGEVESLVSGCVLPENDTLALVFMTDAVNLVMDLFTQSYYELNATIERKQANIDRKKARIQVLRDRLAGR